MSNPLTPKIDRSRVPGIHLKIHIGEEDMAALCARLGTETVPLHRLLQEASESLARQAKRADKEGQQTFFGPTVTFELALDIAAN